MIKRRSINILQAIATWDLIATIRIELMDVDIRAALALTAQWNIYAYDGYFLQCAIQARCPLLTLDRRMRRVAEEMNTKSLELT